MNCDKVSFRWIPLTMIDVVYGIDKAAIIPISDIPLIEKARLEKTQWKTVIGHTDVYVPVSKGKS